MALDIFREKGTPLEKQKFDWTDLVRTPHSKLDDDAFTRVRIILMNGIESEANRFSHSAARKNKDKALQQILAEVRRKEQHQQTLVNWLLPPDLSPLETTIGFEQVAIEVTAQLAQQEPDAYLKQIYDFGLLEDFDHLYRFSALMDRIDGMDANNILQSYTDIRPGRPTAVEHRAPIDDLREPYARNATQPISKLNALTLVAGENQTHDYYMTIGPMFADPVARQLYAEIASIEEQHVTQYESLCDPEESWIEKWMLHEACEVYNYLSCAAYETNPRIKQIWERFVGYELGHLQLAMETFKTVERRDPAEILPQTLPEPIAYVSHREYVREVLAEQVHFRAMGTQITEGEESEATLKYREEMNGGGSPSEMIAASYQWSPGSELSRRHASAMMRKGGMQ